MSDQSQAATTNKVLDLSNPMHIRAEMARRGLTFGHLLAYEDPHRGWVDPLNDDETKVAVRGFMADLWQACRAGELAAQSGSSDPTP